MNTIISNVPWYRTIAVRNAMRNLGLTNQQLFSATFQECDGAAVWAQWRPGVLEQMDAGGRLPRASGNFIVDVDAAIAADFVPTTE